MAAGEVSVSGWCCLWTEPFVACQPGASLKLVWDIEKARGHEFNYVQVFAAACSEVGRKKSLDVYRVHF